MTYDTIGEFHDLFMVQRWQQLAPALGATFGHLTEAHRVLDLGAGTGLGTRTLANVTAARITAIEPSLVQRAQLTARVVDDSELQRRVTVLSRPLPDALDDLAGPIDGFVAAHVLGHLDPGERVRTFAALRQLLSVRGVGLITMPRTLDDSDGASVTHVEELVMGELTYVATYSSIAVDEYLNEYSVRRGGTVLRTAVSRGRWQTPQPDHLHNQFAAVGLSLEVRDDGTGIVRVR